MLQTKQEKTKETSIDNSNLSDKLNSLSSTPKVQEQSYRDVILIYSSCCGCGCSEYKYKRTVPFDSPLQDGDYINSYESTDVYIGYNR